MAWTKFGYPNDGYRYTAAALEQLWPRLHGGDTEAFPQNETLLRAWQAYHAGEFEEAATLGLSLGMDGYAVANKASCVYALCLDPSEASRLATFEAVAERCERQQEAQPDNPAGYYWHGYSLIRFAQSMSVIKALGLGLGGKIWDSLERTIALAPRHADAHVAFGTYHAEVIDKAGAIMASLTYGAAKDEGLQHFRTALGLFPESLSARLEFANALVMLEGKKKMAEALGLYEQAGDIVPLDAREKLDVEAAKEEFEE